METVRAAAVQARPVFLDREATVDKACRLIGEAAAAGAGLVVFPEGSTLYNTQLYFGPDGEVAARHRKLMPTGGERLVWGMGDGSTLPVLDTPFGRLGGLTCWENWLSRGLSTIVGPRGEILAGPLAEQEGILYAELDAARARRTRMEFDPVGHYSRPDLFRLVVDTRRRDPVTTEQDPSAAASPRPDQEGATDAR
jgi:predicted amidohydrolase